MEYGLYCFDRLVNMIGTLYQMEYSVVLVNRHNCIKTEYGKQTVLLSILLEVKWIVHPKKFAIIYLP